MLDRAYLSLPLLLAGASCVPPGAELASASSPQIAYVDLAAMTGRASVSYDLPPGYAAPDGEEALPAALPRIDPRAIAPGAPAKPFLAGEQAEPDQRRSLDCLTAAVYHEARSESDDGQRAVAQVVLNRVRHPAYPTSVCGVVYQGSQRRTGCQFSFTCDGSLARRVEPGAWSRARGVAEQALAGRVYGPVGLATHYHTTAVRPWWAGSLTRAITVGSHIFYRWRGNWGNPLAFRQVYAGAEPGAGGVAKAVADDAFVSAPSSTGPIVRIAALVDGGKVNIHRSGSKTAEADPVDVDGPVRIHRAAGASASSATIEAAEPPTIVAEDVAATQ